ncbi:threonine aldolase family protein [Thermophilibacter sp.]
MRMFRNDYSEGAAPEVLSALVATNDEQSAGYTEEGDAHSERARELIRAACGRDDVDVEFCVGGTSANVIGVTGLLRDWEGAVCTKDAHINVHETGAVAACGRTVLPTDDADGFLTPEAAERVWRFQTSTGRHMTRPGCVYISNTTELGGVWDRARFDAICDWADSHDLPVFLDGARLGSALTSPAAGGLTLEHVAERCGAFYIGGTKNGLLLGEAMVISHPRLRESFPFLQKERGGLLAKGRVLGVQFEAAFERPADGGEALYWRLARSANERALRLRDGLVRLGFEPYGDSPSNQQFFVMSAAQRDAFEAACGCETFYELGEGRVVARFVCSWATRDADVDELLELAAKLA